MFVKTLETASAGEIKQVAQPSHLTGRNVMCPAHTPGVKNILRFEVRMKFSSQSVAARREEIFIFPSCSLCPKDQLRIEGIEETGCGL